MSHSATPSRSRLNSTASPVHKSVLADVKKGCKVRRSLNNDKPNLGDRLLGSQNNENASVPGRFVNRPVVEQFARPRRQSSVAPHCCARRNEVLPEKGLQEKLQFNEALITDLQSELLGLKAELDKAHCLNKELETQNKTLAQDLAAAEAKLIALNTRDQESNGEYKSRKFNDIKNLIANKLERSSSNGPSTIRTLPTAPPPPPVPMRPASQYTASERKAPACPSMPPPPPLPPPPPPPPITRAIAPKTPAIVEFYHSLRKQGEKRDAPISGNQYNPSTTSAHCSIVGEIQNRSAHLLAIKADIETKGDFINGLIQKVLAAAYTDIEDALKFVDWLDGELSLLADERAVLKHFNWPEKKADAIREAAIEYRSLKLLESEITSYKDDTNIQYGSSLKKMAILLDKSEQSIQRLIKLRNSAMHSYQVWKIPTDWMLDSGIVSKIKQASVKLAKMYMRRVITELECSDRESNQEALLLQGVHFAYKAHQFAGGLDSETLCAFEEMRRRVPRHVRGCGEILTGIVS